MAGGLMGRGAGRGRYRPLAEINVTPLVDVMLVLLIIFMVTAPMMTSGVTVDLPKASTAPLNQDKQPITVSINAAGDVFVGEDRIDAAALVGRLQSESGNDPNRRIFVRGDKGVNYGRIMEVMGDITTGGFDKVALLADQPGTRPAASAPANASFSGGARAGRRGR